MVGGLGRAVQLPAPGPLLRGVVQTDADITSRNAGGALLDSAGRMVGISLAVGSKSGINFAIEADAVAALVPQLIAYGKVVRRGEGAGGAGGPRRAANGGLAAGGFRRV